MSQKEWTIIIYMAGDNNLAVDMAYAMEQIRSLAGDLPERPNLFVYYDGNSPSIPTLYCDFSDPKKARYARSFMVQDKLYPVAPVVNENAADENSILNFVDWCVNKVPVEIDGKTSFGRRAERYAFIISGHSLGFQDIGLFRDESSGRSMRMDDLYRVMQRLVAGKEELEQTAAESGLEGDDLVRGTEVLLGQRIDVLGFDSCVMGMLEVGYQFNSVAKTMIASEGSIPSAGWTYAKILGRLARGGKASQSAQEVAEYFVRDFIASQDAYTVGGVSVDLAAWDLSKLGELTVAFDSLATALKSCFDNPKERIYRQMERILLNVHWKCQTYMFDQNIDLADFCELLEEECSSLANETSHEDSVAHLQRVSAACARVLAEIKNAVILSGFSGPAYQYSNGISVFFPWSHEAYEVSRTNYEALAINKHSSEGQLAWPEFLETYLNGVARRKFLEPAENVPAGGKYRYVSGITFDDAPETLVEGAVATGGQEGSKMGGQEGSKMGGQEGSKMGGQEGSKMGGQEGSKMGGQEGSKMGGQEGSKMGGQEGSKMGGQEGSKMGGQEGSKMGGQEGSKMGGQEGSKLGYGGGATHFFDSLRLFKNIEGRWNVSGFTKKAEEESSDAKGASS